VSRFPRFGEHFTLTTYCSGLGKMWAERRTTLMRDGATEAEVEAVSLWVHLDPESWRPFPFQQAEFEAYGDAAAGRQINARLRHPRPAAEVEVSQWRFRATECDIADHVNNAAYWQPLEEELLARDVQPDELDVEIEFRAPAQPGEKQILRDGTYRWIVGDDGETHASFALRG